eukprot:g28434.t1
MACEVGQREALLSTPSPSFYKSTQAMQKQNSAAFWWRMADGAWTALLHHNQSTAGEHCRKFSVIALVVEPIEDDWLSVLHTNAYKHCEQRQSGKTVCLRSHTLDLHTLHDMASKDSHGQASKATMASGVATMASREVPVASCIDDQAGKSSDSQAAESKGQKVTTASPSTDWGISPIKTVEAYVPKDRLVRYVSGLVADPIEIKGEEDDPALWVLLPLFTDRTDRTFQLDVEEEWIYLL